jgi:hypothetical protein
MHIRKRICAKHGERFTHKYPHSPVPIKSCMSKLITTWKTTESVLDKTQYCKKIMLKDEKLEDIQVQLQSPWKFLRQLSQDDHLCGLVVRVPGYKSRGPGFDSRLYHIFWEVVGLEWGPLSLMSTTEELLGRNSSSFGVETENMAVGIHCADHATPSTRKSWH